MQKDCKFTTAPILLNNIVNKGKRRVEEDVNFDVHFHFKISFQFCVATKIENDVIACFSLVVEEKMNIFCDDD